MTHPADRTAAVIVMTAVDDAGVADGLAAALVERRLAGCVQLLPITSRYRWQGNVERAAEQLLLIKTTAERAGDVQRWLADNHPYDVPEVLVVPVTEGAPAYLAWLAAETGG